MTQISVSQLRLDPDKYVSMVNEGDILITKNGKLVAKLTTAKLTRLRLRKRSLGCSRAMLTWTKPGRSG